MFPFSEPPFSYVQNKSPDSYVWKGKGKKKPRRKGSHLSFEWSWGSRMVSCLLRQGRWERSGFVGENLGFHFGYVKFEMPEQYSREYMIMYIKLITGLSK